MTMIRSDLTCVSKIKFPKKGSVVTQDSILERIAAGDTAAVKDCVDRYGGLVWSLSRRFLRNEADAEDAVQDIFVALWSSADRFKSELGTEVTFVGTIARRRLIDRVRKSGRQPPMESLDEEDSPIQPTAPDQVETSAEVEKVGRVLESMAPQQREILSMSLYEGYSHTEISSQLDIPLGTVKTRVRRGLMHIREQLKTSDEDRFSEVTT
jgi:RNA polymerase sigma factor (sigma-70 family)